MPIIAPRISNAAPHGPYVQLSSVSQDAPLLAAAAAVDRAVDRIEASHAPAHIVRTPHLVLRKTTAPPPPPRRR